MSSLRGLIGEAWHEICSGVAWVAIYKDGRSWQAEAFYPEGGDIENGLIFSAEDYREMERIVEVDHKAIYLNGDYFGGLVDLYPDGLKGFSLEKLADEVLYLYETRLHQFKGDFLECMVVPLEASQRTVDGIIAGAEVRSAQQDYCASIYDAENKEYLIYEQDGKVLFGKEEDRLLFYDETEAENVLDMLNEIANAPCVLLRESERSVGRDVVDFVKE